MGGIGTRIDAYTYLTVVVVQHTPGKVGRFATVYRDGFAMGLCVELSVGPHATCSIANGIGAAGAVAMGEYAVVGGSVAPVNRAATAAEQHPVIGIVNDAVSVGIYSGSRGTNLTGRWLNRKQANATCVCAVFKLGHRIARLSAVNGNLLTEGFCVKLTITARAACSITNGIYAAGGVTVYAGGAGGAVAPVNGAAPCIHKGCGVGAVNDAVAVYIFSGLTIGRQQAEARVEGNHTHTTPVKLGEVKRGIRIARTAAVDIVVDAQRPGQVEGLVTAEGFVTNAITTAITGEVLCPGITRVHYTEKVGPDADLIGVGPTTHQGEGPHTAIFHHGDLSNGLAAAIHGDGGAQGRAVLLCDSIV